MKAAAAVLAAVDGKSADEELKRLQVAEGRLKAVASAVGIDEKTTGASAETLSASALLFTLALCCCCCCYLNQRRVRRKRNPYRAM